MSPLGFLQTPPAVPGAAAPPNVDLQLQVEDVLAAARRFWVRGRLRALPAEPQAEAASWWRRWTARATPVPTGAVRLETRISGQVFEANVPVAADGRFEAAFEAELPAVRRGWRVARNKVTCPAGTAEKCGVVLSAPDDPGRVTLVVLPLDYTWSEAGPERFTRSELADQLTTTLRHFEEQPGGQTLYFLAAVPPDAGGRQAELALAAANLGWPHGTFVLFPGDQADAPATLARAVERFRWLFAGNGEPGVLNLEPGLSHDFPKAPAGTGAATTRSAAPHRAVRPTRAGLIPRHPVIFCHGLLAFSALRLQIPDELNCFTPLKQFLYERGFHALYPQVAPTSGVAERAEQLRDQIRAWTDEPVNLVAHSMGGLDARFLISRLGMAPRVRSLTTVATPHRGSFLADWIAEHLREKLPIFLALERLGVNLSGFGDCRPCRCADFNARTPDAAGVGYFSYGACVPSHHVSPVLRRAWNILTTAEGANDGMVSLTSARWGTYLGTLHADHFAQTPDAVFLRPGEDFDAVTFYARLLEDLARRGY